MGKNQIVMVYSHGVGQNVRVSHMPATGETLKALRWDMDRDGGKGTNVAVALGRLGVSTALITRVGDDVWADMGEKWLLEAGVDTAFVLRDSAIATGTGIVLVDECGNNSIVLSSADYSVPHSLIESGIAENRDCRIFITGFETDAADAIYALRLAKKEKMMTILNASPVPDGKMPDLSSADIVIVNEQELCMLMALAGADGVGESLEAAVADCVEQYGLQNLVVTLGGDGFLLQEPDRVIRVLGISCPVVDTSGAGDGFLAAMAYRLLEGDSLPDACRWANAYAAITVQYSGTIPAYLTREEVNEKISAMKAANKVEAW